MFVLQPHYYLLSNVFTGIKLDCSRFNNSSEIAQQYGRYFEYNCFSFWIGECPEIPYRNVSFSQWNVTGDCYVRLNVTATYEEAEDLCANISSRLLSIRSNKEQQWVYNTMENRPVHANHMFSSSSSVWLGAKLLISPWMWQSKPIIFSSRITYLQWFS